ncbi:outer membrane protein assembly factor BamD [Desulfovibrio aminophilus]|nr:outer membrane protein assembly factor BamD [Desulfovibrio aminophilus]MCM0755816.1 outer membrane protein assembly factor BamD [Desulfovibrio aminophilus]
MRRRLFVPALFLLLLAFQGCGLIDYYFLPKPEDTAQELFEAGMDAMQEKKYGDAAEYFSKLKDQFPFSPFTLKAEVSLGDAYFLDEKYPEAVNAYKEFESLHPRHEDTPYVLFQIGLSNFNLFKSFDRRMSPIEEALEYFQRVRESYPNSKYAKPAADYVVQCRRKLAEHELYIADFFWRTDQYGPAWNRYRYVVENFQDQPDLRDYARRRAEYAYYEYQKTLTQEERERIEGGWKQWLKKWL